MPNRSIHSNVRNRTLFLTQASLIAALYVVLTYIAQMMGLASGAIQVRFSETLAILPYFLGAAVPGLFVGCIIANILTSGNPFDIVFGSLATLAASIFTYGFGLRGWKWLAPIPAIVINAIVIPFVIRYGFGAPNSIPFLMLTVGAGQIISCGVLGYPLLYTLDWYRKAIFGKK